MENVKYIPGDLVLSDNNHKIVWKVSDISQDKKGNILYRLRAAEENDAFIYLRESQIAPVPLIPAILEANGWEKNEYGVYYKNFNPHKAVCLTKEDGSNWSVSVGSATLIHCKFLHELQHLLFGLGLPSDLKV